MSGQLTGPWPAPDWRVRARAVLADRLPVVVAMFLLLAAVGGAVTYGAVVAPGTERRTHTVGEWTESTGYRHSATVQERNPVYPVGATLSNRSAYFTSVSPVLNGSYGAGYDADSGSLRARTTLTLVISAGDDGTTYWAVTDRVGRRSATLSPGDRLTIPFSINVSHVRERVRNIEASLGTAGETTVSLRATTRYRGTVDGRQVSANTTRVLDVDPGSQLYGVSGGEPTSDRHRWTEQSLVRKPAGPLRLFGGPLLLLVGLLCAAGGVKAEREEILDLTTRERAALERAEFTEWVTIGTVPDEPSGQRIRVASLEGLVDLAADTNSRIVQDEHLGHYVVLADDVHYLYEPLGRESL